ncbi:50S ribosomal protein L25/general stress protein Ctc [Marixanthomonas sp. SCSIO 43207]|uniref:50S ribosomal protein L25/general stress protein Ctc n=1 Tax=Marixanthomonas sp. SCSIO 43207 TaxID=2779360 RepID=UPI001CA947F5|nr:50S ribosomal protein L25/general stress protein Ctc [Marixanthomonas sp. SCSIO 43207]UAB82205.1 50S ribosomal protein L25/general stress protein Ctc [Marixanthomonas sp. SCSIO 43207]
MKSLTIKGSKRESVGKSATKALRNAGKVPCVVYGGDETVHFSAYETEFQNLIYTPDVFRVVLELEGGETIDCALQDIQFHPVTDQILHIDFYQLFDGTPISMTIPVRVSGNARGVKNGGVLRIINRRLRVRALPKNLPDFIDVDITNMKIGDVYTVGDVKTEDFEFLQDDKEVICQVRTSRTAIVDEADEDEDDEDEEGAEGDTEGAAEGAENTEAPAEE